MEIVFWGAASALAYVYVLFPLLVYARGRLSSRETRKAPVTPSVSLIIVAHDEAAGIDRKLRNVLALDYPRDRLQVLVASDGSTDGTDALVATYRSRNVELLSLPRRGKIPALNDAVRRAEGEILVFSDANSIFDPETLRVLMRGFADPAVGGVAGNQVYTRRGESAAAAGERSYWGFDRWLKLHQSAAGSVTSATGALYAVRRELFAPVPGGVGDDAVVSYRVVASGKRLIFEPEAVAYEPVSPDAGAEFRRKTRVCARGLRGLLVEPRLFDPRRHGFYSLQLASHKLLRWMTPWLLASVFVASLALWPRSAAYRWTAGAQAVFYAFALAGWMLPGLASSGRLSRLLSLPFFFCLTNAAFVTAQWWVLQGRRIDRWEVRREESPT